MSARFLTPLRVEELEPESGWFLVLTKAKVLEPLVAEVTGIPDKIVVPAGFETNYATVFRLPLLYLFFGRVGDAAAVVHDWLYYVQSTTRKEADRAFYYLLRAKKVSRWRALFMWAGVRCGGWLFWNRRTV